MDPRAWIQTGDDGIGVRWLQSYVTEDRIYCVGGASNEDMILEHARGGGFAADRVTQLFAMIDPASGE